jgi:biopolymer transport protein ExbB
LTTAAGLLIAIPSLIMYTNLAGRVDALVMEMDDLAQNVVQLISAEGLSSRTVASPRVRSRKVSAKPPAESPEKKAV